MAVRLADTAYESLRAQILSGELPHGTHLAEEDLAANLNISRTPVREALRRLAADGLVDFAPNRGASVIRWEREELRDIFDVRALLEAYATERAVANASDELVEKLDELCGAMNALMQHEDSEKRRRELGELNSQFHQTLIDAAGSKRLGVMIESLLHVPRAMNTYMQYSPDALKRSMVQHAEIVEAVRAKDAVWAASIMRAHLLAARDEFINRL